MTEYYVSAAGDDTGSGSFTSPWKTIAKANTAMASMGLKNRVRFRRGDTFYGRLTPPTFLNPASSGWLQIGAYGTGERPIISGYKILNTASGWAQEDADTWKVDLATANADVTYTGFSGDQNDVGFIKVDGTLHAVKYATTSGLTNQWDFTYVGTTLYVRSTAKPTTLAADIRCATKGNSIVPASAIEVADLHFTGCGGHGLSYYGGTSRSRALGNLVTEIGGSYLSGTTRYGNGVQVWLGGGATDVYMERNDIRDVFDTAFTIQGNSVGQTGAANNITWRRNITRRCSQAEEYWYEGNGAGFVNTVSEYNTNLFPGYGFGATVRTDQWTRVAQLSYHWGWMGNGVTPAAISGPTVRRNIYYCPYGALAGRVDTPTGLTCQRNVALMRPSTHLMHYDPTLVATPTEGSIEAAIAGSTGREQNTIFGLLPSNADASVNDSAVTSALTALNVLAPTGQRFGNRMVPIHSIWA